mgnify:FL=1
MTTRTKTITPRDIAKIAFPEWRGRKVSVADGNRVYVGGTFWDGGSRTQYVAVRLATGERCDLPPSAQTPREMGGTAPDALVTVPDGYAMVAHSIFCGRDAGCTVTLGSPMALDAKATLALDAGE